MRPFNFNHATSEQNAIQAAAQDPGAVYIAGGTNLVDLMKEGVEAPSTVIDITHLPLKQIEKTENGVRIGALVSNSALAQNTLIQRYFPVLSEAVLAGASPQLRNAASVGGNLMQRTRCSYFYDTAFACNKRQPGAGCSARDGFNRMHAIFGASEQCVATHPSDMCVALAALDAVIQVTGPNGAREIPIGDFHRLPGDQPQYDTVLQHGELITAVDIPYLPDSARSHYLKIRDRASYEFALVSVAAVLDADADGTIQLVRLAMGGVAHKPWRLIEAEQMLAGLKMAPRIFADAADLALEGAQPLAYNAFKIPMAKRAIQEALFTAAGLEGSAR